MLARRAAIIIGIMVDPATQTLYLMQNEHGLIKVGRSIHPQRRLKKLISTERCHIEIVEQFPNCGDLEEHVHIALDEFRVVGEWFHGSADARLTIAAALGIDDIEWPFEFDIAKAERWIEDTVDLHVNRSTVRYVLRFVEMIRWHQNPADQNNQILRIWHDLAYGGWPDISYRETRRGNIIKWREPHTGKLVPIPDFSGDLDIALTVWPEKQRPSEWVGTALECSLAGIKAWVSKS